MTERRIILACLLAGIAVTVGKQVRNGETPRLRSFVALVVLTVVLSIVSDFAPRFAVWWAVLILTSTTLAPDGAAAIGLIGERITRTTKGTP